MPSLDNCCKQAISLTMMLQVSEVRDSPPVDIPVLPRWFACKALPREHGQHPVSPEGTAHLRRTPSQRQRRIAQDISQTVCGFACVRRPAGLEESRSASLCHKASCVYFMWNSAYLLQTGVCTQNRDCE